MLPDDLIAFIIEEAQHQVINNKCTKMAESVLAAVQKSLRNLEEKTGVRVNIPSQMLNAITVVDPDTPNWTVGPRVVGKKVKDRGRGRRKKNKQKLL